MGTKPRSPVDVELDGNLVTEIPPHPLYAQDSLTRIFVSARQFYQQDQLEHVLAVLGPDIPKQYQMPHEVMDRIWERLSERRNPWQPNAGGLSEPERYVDRDDFSWWCISDNIVCFDMEAAFLRQTFAIEVAGGAWIEGKCVAWKRPSLGCINREPELVVEVMASTYHVLPAYATITAPLRAWRRVTLNWQHRYPQQGKED